MKYREQAIEWWDLLDHDTKYHWFSGYCNRYTRGLEDIREDEIIEIWVDNIKPKLSDLSESLTLGNFTINKPKEWDKDNVVVEISDYDHESTSISIGDLKILQNYINTILDGE